ncbi:MAG TPA: hypothetical protein VM223_23440 [Planctomycetota bacterium]|nr:hypothetical protein [Planctomycetota bacterium]
MRRVILPLLATLLLITHAAAGERTVSLDLRGTPLPVALTRLQDASGLHLAFADDIVRDAEPVTLSAKDEPVDSVLLRLLRPRGLELIYTGETMAAILPAATEEGMAKAAGRALRTFARLERKLEKAVQVADEVKVPEWTVADDRALVEGIVDLAAAAYYFNQRKRETGGKPFDLAHMLNSFDKDMRVGACCPVMESWSEEKRTPEDLAAIEAAVLKAIDDPDPEIRATGIWLVACVNRLYGDKWAPVIQKVVEVCMKDPAPEPRFAAVVARAAGLPTPAMETLASELRTDPNPAVRAAAWLFWLDKQRRSAGPELLDEFRQAIIAEKNPILKSLGVIIALVVWEGKAEQLAEICNAPEVQGNAWLKISADLVLGVAQQMTSDAAQRRAEAGIVRSPGLAREKMIEATTALLISGKRSHQILAGMSGLFGVRTILRPAAKQPKPDLSKLTTLADSADLWERFLGIMISAAANDQPGVQRVLKALESKDPLDRIAALVACAADRPNEDSEANPEMVELSKKLSTAVLAFLRSPIPCEQYLALEAIRGRVPFDDLLAMLQDEIRRDPNSELAKVLVRALGVHRDLMMGTDELRNQRLMMALDAVLESKNAELELLFIGTIRWRIRQNQPMLLTLICDCEPKVLTSMLTDRNSWSELRNEDYAVRAVLERLKAVFAQKDPASRLLAARGLTGYMPNAHKLWNQEEFRATTLELLTRMLDVFVLQGNTPEQFAAGCDLLCGAIGRRGPVADLPAGVRAAIVRVLGAAGDPARSAKAAAVLRECYSHNGPDDADLAPVMEAARLKIMAGNHPGDKAVVLCGMIQTRDENASRTAAADLQARLIAGTVPAENRPEAIRMIGNRRRDLPDEFARFALQKLADPGEAADLRQEILNMLTEQPARYGGLIDVLAKMSSTKDQGFDCASSLGNLGSPMRRELTRLKEQGQPVPAWAAKAAKLGLSVMNDTARQPYYRRQGMILYAHVAGPAASELLEKIIFDPKAELSMRSQAVSMAVGVNPESKVLATIAEKYATLPLDVRRIAGDTAARAQNAPGAEALLIAFVKDKEIGSSRFHALTALKPPATPALMAALKELENDPQIGRDVKYAIERLERKE